MILGFTGTFGSGKTTIADYLKAKGFQFITISDLVREEARKRGLSIERKVLQDIGNEMRERYGVGFWAKKVLEKINKETDCVVDGIRNPGEIEELRKVPGFVLLSFDAPVEERLKRLVDKEGVRKERADSDPTDVKEIRRLEVRDRGEGEPLFGQQVGRCMEMADFKVETNQGVEFTLEEIEKIIDLNKK